MVECKLRAGNFDGSGEGDELCLCRWRAPPVRHNPLSCTRYRRNNRDSFAAFIAIAPGATCELVKKIAEQWHGNIGRNELPADMRFPIAKNTVFAREACMARSRDRPIIENSIHCSNIGEYCEQLSRRWSSIRV